jgi:histidinol-phosphate aminotransferase
MIVRDLSSYNLNAIRVTVGTAEQNSKFFELTDELLN